MTLHPAAPDPVRSQPPIAASHPASVPMLAIRNMQVVYGGAIEAVRDVSLEVPAGRIVALLGSNGAGKSTVLKAVSAVLDAEDGKIEKGSIQLQGRPIEQASAHGIVGLGLVQVPEGRRLFATLTVEENLVVGAHLQDRRNLAEARDYVFGLFPRLVDKRHQIAGYLSGGEQQMVAIGRALMSRPRMLALDEPSLGLAPLVVSEIFEAIQTLRERSGLTILLVEHHAEALGRNADVREFYLGLSTQQGRTSMRDVKHYKRRKRWLS